MDVSIYVIINSFLKNYLVILLIVQGFCCVKNVYINVPEIVLVLKDSQKDQTLNWGYK